MKKKVYNILKWIPIVNLALPKPAVSIGSSLAREEGITDVVFDYIQKHPSLKEEVLTEKMVSEILGKTKR